MNEWIIHQMNDWMKTKSMNKWSNVWFSEWLNEWMNECLNGEKCQEMKTKEKRAKNSCSYKRECEELKSGEVLDFSSQDLFEWLE